MSKNIKDYLHLYLGCECRIGDSKKREWIRMVSELSVCTGINHLNIQIWYKSSSCKPILRPLSDITKEEVADLMGVDGFIKRGNWSEPFFQCEYEDLSNDQRFKHLYITQMSPTQTVFLIKSRFDLFNLIPEELAIDKTKTNK
jgi:hypothetical protein